MKKLYLLKTFLLACLFSIVGGGMAWAETVTDILDFSSMGFANQTVITNCSSGPDKVSVSFNKGTHLKTAPTYYTSTSKGSGVRVYSGNYFTVTVPKGKVLKNIVITFGKSDGSNVITVSEGTYDTNKKTWTPSTAPNSVKFTIGGESGYRQIQALAITYEGEGGGESSLLPVELSFSASTAAADLKNPAEFKAPTLTTKPDGLTVTYSSSDKAVATVDAETGKVTLVGVGSTIITAKSEQTKTYSAGSASYTLNVIDTTPIVGLAGLRAKVTDNKSQEYTVNVTDAVVTYVNGKNAYLQTAEGAVLCFGTDALGLTQGKKINGQIVVNAMLYNGLLEVTAINTEGANVTTAEGELAPQVVTVADIIANPTAYESRYVTIKGVQVTAAFSNKNAKISQEGKEYALRQNGKDELSVNLNDIIDVTGFPSIYNKTLQFSVYEQDHIVKTGEVPYFRFAEAEYSAMHKTDFDAPAVETNVEGTPVYTSSNPAVATVDGKTGAVTLVGVGTTVITATLDAYNASYTLTVTPYVQTVFVPVVDQSEVVAGGKYIVLNKDGDKAMGAKGSGSYLSAVDVALENGVYTGTVDGMDEAYAFTLVASGNYFKLQHGSEYLYGSSNSGSGTYWNGLNGTNADGYLWTIDMTKIATSPIVNKYSKRQLGYNSKNVDPTRFASYATSNTDYAAVLYRQYEAQDITLTIGEAGYATYYSDKALVVPAGMEATTVTAANNDGTLAMAWEYQAGSVVPAGTAVLLRGAANSYPTYLLSDYPVAAPTGNLLHGSVEAATTTGGAKYYKLTYATIGGQRTLGFFWGAEDGAAFTNAAGKAYLALPAEAAANGYRLDGGDVTAIGQIATDVQGEGQVYSISGVRMDGSKRLPAGIYIINGRKVIVK